MNLNLYAVNNLPLPGNQPRARIEKSYVPSENDILCGRGKSFLNHTGNQRFSKVIRANLKKYIDASSRIDRSHVVAAVVRALRSDGFRFLKMDETSQTYYELNMDQAREKTGHAIRDLMKLTAGKRSPKKQQALKKKKRKAQSKSAKHPRRSTAKGELDTPKMRTKRNLHTKVLDEEREGKRWSRKSEAANLLCFENLLEYGLFDLGKEEQSIGECCTCEKGESSQQGGNLPLSFGESPDTSLGSISLSPLPLSSEMCITLADMSRITEILSGPDGR